MSNNKISKSKKCVSITKNILKFLSWNIQAPSSAEGDKFKLHSFQKIIMAHDFVCLQEIRREVHLPGFHSECNLRKSSSSGGVGILVKKELEEGVEFIKCIDGSDFIICRLHKDFFKQKKDIYLVNVYAKPHNSSHTMAGKNGKETMERAEDTTNNEQGRGDFLNIKAGNSGKETMKSVEDVINDLRGVGEVILCGDFNSRIGQKSGIIEHDLDDHIPMPHDYIPDEYTERFSQDTKSNPNGTHFLNLIRNNQLTILNGRTLDDFTGKFTSIQKQGCSVIDYFALSKNIKTNINYFKIQDLTEYSDHKTLTLELSCQQFDTVCSEPINTKYMPAPTRFLFSEENKEKFLASQNHENSVQTLKYLNLCIDNLEESSKNNQQLLAKIINEVNNKFTEYLCTIASLNFKETKTNNSNKKPNGNNPWFNWKTRHAKREMRKATKTTSDFPTSDFLRENFYKVKSNYKSLLRKTSNRFFEKMNKEIEDGKVLNWQSFKKLKNQKSTEINFDSQDMEKFENFFTELYSDNHKTISNDRKEQLLKSADNLNTNSPSNQLASQVLNNKITITEVTETIKSLKSGKASSLDKVSNEILKCLNSDHLNFLKKLFLVCLEKGIYPWNESIITPLHKKGKKSNPDNFRAIAVSSAIGKVFSTILLNRLIEFRKTNCPDPPNQQGFTKNAQTYDHILTIQTVASKYKKMGKPVYAVFVDFKKAFDSVCRQALFYKMARCGINGNFYNVLRSMYSNSFAYVKLSGHINNRFQIMKGTEQGHPLSPDLFRIFLSDLSPLLEFNNCPQLSNLTISHLLWADDLILLSTKKETTQMQLNTLQKFCDEWGIEINELKTQAMILGSNTNTSNLNFSLYNKPLEIVDSYCYLGIILHKSGSLASSQLNLKNKAMRAFFGLKRVIMRSKLSFKALLTLFDSLIKPIILYGAPLWTPTKISPLLKA